MMGLRYLAAGAAVAATVAAATPAQALPDLAFAIWSGVGLQTIQGTITTPSGTVGVTFSSLYSDELITTWNSDSIGPYYGGTPSTMVYDAASLPGTADTTTYVAQNDYDLWTLTFSQPVTNPVISVWNLDFRPYVFQGVTPVILPGALNLAVSGMTLYDPTGGYDLAGPGAGGPDGSGYGSVEFPGTYTTITWFRPLSYTYAQDGGGTFVALFVPEPASIAVLSAAMLGLGVARRRRG